VLKLVAVFRETSQFARRDPIFGAQIGVYLLAVWTEVVAVVAQGSRLSILVCLEDYPGARTAVMVGVDLLDPLREFAIEQGICKRRLGVVGKTVDVQYGRHDKVGVVYTDSRQILCIDGDLGEESINRERS
jgi:hypothetical protein